ncbi:MAG: tetratricopeptide repeat protein, partial [Kordiimonas sp.]
EQLESAEKAYESALKLQPNYAEAHFNLGLVKHQQGDLKGAEAKLLEAIKLQPQNPTFHNAIGIIHQDLNNLDGAETAFKHALMLDNNYFKALHNLGALLRSQFRYDDALVFLKRAMTLAPRIVEPRYIVANIYYEQGDFEKADEEYRKVIGLQPDYAEAHESLNKLYWEHGKSDLYGKSYAIGIKANPESAQLCENHLRALSNASRTEEGIELGKTYASSFPTHAGVHEQLARLQATSGNFEAAEACYTTAVKNAPENKSVRISASQFLIQAQEYTKALEHLEAAENQAPDDQEMWAYRGLCWRLMGDERHEWLNNFEQFVGPAVIETPPGYSTLEDFLAELKETLRGCHTAKQAPIDQTLRGGSQTHGTLFERQEPIFGLLQNALKEAASNYIGNLPKDDTHPLCRRNTGSFDFSASWSVWLREGGFHINHVHPLGWISSAFYVDVPKASEEARAEKEGWIKFGESPLLLGGVDQAARFVEPKPGLLALFPSYMWHGTVAYHNDADRITTPFDIIPI